LASRHGGYFLNQSKDGDVSDLLIDEGQSAIVSPQDTTLSEWGTSEKGGKDGG
jgi:hypothetical protein